jgi:hypothetical protein
MFAYANTQMAHVWIRIVLQIKASHLHHQIMYHQCQVWHIHHHLQRVHLRTILHRVEQVRLRTILRLQTILRRVEQVRLRTTLQTILRRVEQARLRTIHRRVEQVHLRTILLQHPPIRHQEHLAVAEQAFFLVFSAVVDEKRKTLFFFSIKF